MRGTLHAAANHGVRRLVPSSGPHHAGGSKASLVTSPWSHRHNQMPPSRGGPAPGSRSRTLLFCGAAAVCYVMYSTLHASTATYEAKAPVAYRPHSVPEWSATGASTYEAQASKEAAAGGLVGGHEVLLSTLRDYLSRRSEVEVDLLKQRLRDILEGPAATGGAAGTATTERGRTTADAAEQKQQQKRLRTTGREQGGSSLSPLVGSSREKATVQWQGQGSKKEEESGRAAPPSKTQTVGGSGHGPEAEAPGGLKEEASKVGLDLLWWTDTTYQAKTAEEEEAQRDAEYAEKCRQWKSHYAVVPGASWGDLPYQLQEEWKSVNCDEYLVEVKDIVPSYDCTNEQADLEGLPLIAIMAAATTRNVKNIKLKKLALFRHLMPSIVRTVECGFRYKMVVGYDLGDSFYDSKEGQAQVHRWFKETIEAQLDAVNIPIDLLLVPVDNTLQKPGPVFLDMARAAYAAGADYFYRVNDDTEFLNPWATAFVGALHAMGFPYGAVGPLCRQGNTKILTHDFTHRTHMDIFEGEYYPPQLTDWWMDDWIARAYGSTRTRQAKSIEVIHHTGAHGQRYNVDPTHQTLLDGLVNRGRQKVITYMTAKGVAEKEVERFKNSRFDKFPLEDIAPPLSTATAAR